MSDPDSPADEALALAARDRGRLQARAADEGWLSAKEAALVAARRAAFDAAFEEHFAKAKAAVTPPP